MRNLRVILIVVLLLLAFLVAPTAYTQEDSPVTQAVHPKWHDNSEPAALLPPFSETFDDTTFPPAGWARFRGTNGLGAAYDWVRTATTQSGAGAAFVRYENVSGGQAEDWLVTPLLPITVSENILSFWMRQSFAANYGSTYTIRVSTSSQTSHASFAIVQTYAETAFNTTYQNFTVDLSTYIGQSVYIAFVMTQDDGDDWYVDTVSLVGATNTWLGNTTDWHTASNWSLGVVPSLATNPVVIPTAPTGGNFPTITAAAAAGGPITIQASANVAMTGGSLTLLNNLAATGTFNSTGGTTIISGTTSLSGTGSKTFYDVTVNEGAVLTPATAMTVNGTMTVNGEVSHNAGAETYNGPVHIGATSVVQYIGAGNHTYNGPVTIDAGGEWATVFSTGIANFNSSLTNNGLLYVADTGTFNLNSDYDGTGRFRYYAGLGTINLAGSGARSVGGTPNFYNLAIAAAAVVNGSGSWTVFGNWTNNGSFNGDGTHTVTFAGVTALSGSGSSNFNHVLMGRSVSAGSHAFSVAGDWGRSGTFTPGTTTVTFAGGDQAIDGFGEGAAANSYSISPALAVPDNGCATNNFAISTLSVADSYVISDVDVNLTLTHTWVSDLNIYLFSPAGTLVALSTGNGGNGDNYTNTTFDDEATAEITAGTAPFTGGYRPEGILATLDGENVNGTWELWVCDAASTDVGTIGSWSIAVNAPLAPNGTGTTFYNMTVNNGSHVTTNVNVAIGNNLMVHAGGWLELGLNNMTVEGTVANLGTVQQTKDTPAAATTEFLHIQNAAATVTKYRGVAITPAGAMGETTVLIQGNQVSGCSSGGGSELMSRCFDISPTTSQNATVRFYYTEAERNGQTANALSVWHFGTTWQQTGNNYSYSETVPSCSSGPFCWVQADNIASFSPFGLGSGAGPTALSLQQFRVATPVVLPLALLFVGLILVGATFYMLRRRTA